MPGVIDGHTRHSPYSYTPSAGANIAFLVIFAYHPFLFYLLTAVFCRFVTLDLV